MRRIINFTSQFDYVAVETMYMAFSLLREKLVIEKVIEKFHLSEDEAMKFFVD